MAKVLVTGANGFVGGWLTRSLVESGHAVTLLLRHAPSEEIQGLPFEVVHGDITNSEDCVRATKNQEAVFHLAGVVGYSALERELMERVNVRGTDLILEASIQNGVAKFIHMSSVVAIGASESPQNVLTETSPYTVARYNLGYFETKRKAEEIVFLAAQKKRIHAVAVNPSTIYGPADAKKGSRRTQLKVAKGKFPFNPPGGASIVAIEDVIQGILAAWSIGKSGERYILSGDNLTLKAIFEIIAKCAGVRPPQHDLSVATMRVLGKVGDLAEFAGLKLGISSETATVARLYHWFDNSKARRELGLSFKPAQDSITRSVAWMKENRLIP